MNFDKGNNVNSFSLSHNYCYKSVLLVPNVFPGIDQEIETTNKRELTRMLKSTKDEMNFICLKRCGFILDIDKTVPKNMRNVLKNKVTAACFNKYNNMALSRKM